MDTSTDTKTQPSKPSENSYTPSPEQIEKDTLESLLAIRKLMIKDGMTPPPIVGKGGKVVI